MQYGVTPMRIKDCASEFERAARTQQEINETVRQVRSSLGRLSGMSGVSRDLFSALQDMEQGRRGMQDMAQAAWRIAAAYERTEREVAAMPDRTVYSIRRAASGGMGRGAMVTAQPVEMKTELTTIGHLVEKLNIRMVLM